MNYNIKYSGFNLIKNEEEYKFIPFTKKNCVIIEIKLNCIINFSIEQSNNLSNVIFYQKNKKKLLFLKKKKKFVLIVH